VQTSASVNTPTSPAIAQTICAVVVTFYADTDLADRISRVARQVPQIVIVDNGSSSACVDQLKHIADSFSTHLILNSRNEGLGAGLNKGIRWAASQGFQWALTLDQDTTVAPEMVETLAAVVDSYSPSERLAVVGSNFRDKINGALFREPASTANGSAGTEMASVLTSGSLISIPVFQSIGAFRDDFFIDCLDHEYCLRARSHGFHVVLTSRPVMEHGIGHVTSHRLLWRNVNTSNHSPLRRYFTVRNTLILTREYLFKDPGWITYALWGLTKSLVLILLFETDRIAKLKFILRGGLDGIFGRTGPLKQPNTEITLQGRAWKK
jgi:rhamnosyltransferase